MINTAPITEPQKDILQKFTCERLSSNPKNAEEIQDFFSDQGEGLERALKTHAWTADRSGTTAYYLIRNPEGEIVMFFSLKCGMLFDPDYAMPYLEAFQDKFELDDAASRWMRLMDGDEREARYFQNQADLMGPAKFNHFVESLRIKTDKQQEPNKKIIRVEAALPAIELVEFCTNDMTKDCWQSYGFPAHRKLGETMFWWFIVPKMLEINTLIGCKYVYLFAADKSLGGKLSSYYRERLHFNNMTHLGTVKPSYDLNCFFMGRQLRSRTGLSRFARRLLSPNELWGLDHYQEAYFNEFNLNPDANDLV